MFLSLCGGNEQWKTHSAGVEFDGKRTRRDTRHSRVVGDAHVPSYTDKLGRGVRRCQPVEMLPQQL